MRQWWCYIVAAGENPLMLRSRESNRKEEKMRTVDDLLNDQDDDEIDGNKSRREGLDASLTLSSSIAVSSCPDTSITSTTTDSFSSPRSLLSRWFPSLQKASAEGGEGLGLGRLVRFRRFYSNIKKKKKEGEKEDEVGKEVVGPSINVLGRDGCGGSGPAVGSSELSVASGGKHEDISFNLGMGVGLVFILAKSAAEFNKMIELRTQMEMLLKEIKDEVQRKDAIASSSESNENISFSPSSCCGDLYTSMTTSIQNRSASCDLEGAKCAKESVIQLNYESAFENTKCVSMDQMEAELEVELERLQLNLEGEDSSLLQQKMELASENSDPYFESISDNFEEDDVPKEDNDKYHGVSAHELERRLHELLETRQQERIAELESSLEFAEKKLRQKELELHWWRDTQSVASQKDETFIK